MSYRVEIPRVIPSKDILTYNPALSPLHNEIFGSLSRYSPDHGKNEWTLDDLYNWKVNGADIHNFKSQWVHGCRNAINAAARRFDLPPELVAGLVYNEVGGDPLFVDDALYAARSVTGLTCSRSSRLRYEPRARPLAKTDDFGGVEAASDEYIYCRKTPV